MIEKISPKSAPMTTASTVSAAATADRSLASWTDGPAPTTTAMTSAQMTGCLPIQRPGAVFSTALSYPQAVTNGTVGASVRRVPGGSDAGAPLVDSLLPRPARSSASGRCRPAGEQP